MLHPLPCPSLHLRPLLRPYQPLRQPKLRQQQLPWLKRQRHPTQSCQPLRGHYPLSIQPLHPQLTRLQCPQALLLRQALQQLRHCQQNKPQKPALRQRPANYPLPTLTMLTRNTATRAPPSVCGWARQAV